MPIMTMSMAGATFVSCHLLNSPMNQPCFGFNSMKMILCLPSRIFQYNLLYEYVKAPKRVEATKNSKSDSSRVWKKTLQSV
jgi:hypothetical protein